MVDRLKFRANREVWADTIELRAGIEHKNQKWQIAEPLLFKEYPDHYIVEPFLRLSMEDAQALMDELWNCGLRPTEGSGSAGAMAATQKHLEDMRILVFNKDK